MKLKLKMDRSKAILAIADVFRNYGFNGASLSILSKAAGLGKGSLYHFFPHGKEEMADAILKQIDNWFDIHIFQPLNHHPNPKIAVLEMFTSVDAYFQSGERVCLVGVFALGDERDRFTYQVQSYFSKWIDALCGALEKIGHDSTRAQDLSEDAIAGIQGALVIARAINDPIVFTRSMNRIKDKLVEG